VAHGITESRNGGMGGHDTYSPALCYRPCMARLARIVVPGLPHHVTQRGNRREAIFFEDGDHEVYLEVGRNRRTQFP
jgi:hypothetical protein